VRTLTLPVPGFEIGHFGSFHFFVLLPLVSRGPELLLIIWRKEEDRVRGGERLRRAVLAESQEISERGPFPSIV
jgi:hypothetical protein